MGSAPSVHVDELSCEAAWSRITEDQSSVLVDVRTQAEWAFVGLPLLSAANKEPVLLEWQSFPSGERNYAFADQLTALLDKSEKLKSTQVLFLCRSGARSRNAAHEMAARGFEACSNITDGFEGPVDESGRRGRVSGWKFSGLPWAQG
ncbi:MAG: rhodanese-like domain-containing protein [Pseudomonadota bacterium]